MPKAMEMLRLFLQIFIGTILMASALGKALDLAGFADVLKTYQAFPESALFFIALAVTIFEFVLGAWMLGGWNLQGSAITAAVMNTTYAVWMTVTLFRGLQLENCGCFGVFFPRPLTWFSPIEDMVMVAMCILLAYLAQDRTEKCS